MANREYQEHYTARDYALWKGDWELIYGAPYAMSPSPSITHQRTERQLFLILQSALQNCSACEVLFEMDVQLSDDTVVRPDLLVICNQVAEHISRAPEMIVEIVSPSSAQKDERLKFELYQQEGVQIYLLVYPDAQKIKVFTLEQGRYIKHGDFQQETYHGKIKDCEFALDFAQAWSKIKQ